MAKNEELIKAVIEEVKKEVKTKATLDEDSKKALVKEIVDEVKKEINENAPVVRKTKAISEISKDELNTLYDSYLVSVITGKDPTQTKVFEKEKKYFSKDWSTSDFSDWIPTAYSTQVIEQIYPKTVAAQLFPRIAMKQNPYKIPSQLITRNAWLKFEGTPFTKRLSGGSDSITFNATTIMTAAALTDELTEDSVIPMLPKIKQSITDSLAYAIENAIINGQKTVTLDNDVTAADDHRKAWNGLRAFAHDASRSATSVYDLSTFDVAHLLEMRARMGKYGLDVSKLVYLVSPTAMYKFIGLNEVLTVKDYGNNATILKGEIGRLFNIPIVVSSAVRSDLDDTGVNSSTAANNVKTEVLLAYHDAFDQGIWRDVKFEPYREPSVGNVLYASLRMDFQPEYKSASDILVVAGVNVA